MMKISGEPRCPPPRIVFSNCKKSHSMYANEIYIIGKNFLWFLKISIFGAPVDNVDEN
jgi:hypothetical protein